MDILSRQIPFESTRFKIDVIDPLAGLCVSSECDVARAVAYAVRKTEPLQIDVPESGVYIECIIVRMYGSGGAHVEIKSWIKRRGLKHKISGIAQSGVDMYVTKFIMVVFY